jgi:anaerobic selenocysteine-containing dehydrogenase
MTATVDEQTTVTVRGACPHDCPDTCAMLVSVRGGRAVEVRGDPGHPFTRGDPARHRRRARAGHDERDHR